MPDIFGESPEFEYLHTLFQSKGSTRGLEKKKRSYWGGFCGKVSKLWFGLNLLLHSPTTSKRPKGLKHSVFHPSFPVGPVGHIRMADESHAVDILTNLGKLVHPFPEQTCAIHGCSKKDDKGANGRTVRASGPGCACRALGS